METFVATSYPLLTQDGTGSKILAINIADDGIGFNPDTPEGFGLCGMRERVEGIGGQLVIHSAPTQGTRIKATLPISETRTS